MTKMSLSNSMLRIDARGGEKRGEIALEVYLKAFARYRNAENKATAEPAHWHRETTKPFVKFFFVERIPASSNPLELFYELVSIDDRSAGSGLERMLREIGVGYRSLGERKQQFSGCPRMSEAAVAVRNLSGAHGRFAARGGEHHD